MNAPNNSAVMIPYNCSIGAHICLLFKRTDTTNRKHQLLKNDASIVTSLIVRLIWHGLALIDCVVDLEFELFLVTQVTAY